QLQHQDPFAPTSGADMVAQLAQLSSVEQAKATNDQLAELTAQQTSAASASLANLVGRYCDAKVGAFQLDGKGGAMPPLEVSSPSAMKGASVVITDADGKEIRRVPIPDGVKESLVAWDGKDANGNVVKPGTYKMEIEPGTGGSAVSGEWSGKIDSVELTAGGPRLRMGGILLSPGDITSFGATATTTTSNGVSL
ncbi:MAG: flagellar hook capping FlgD N-terminal domain-containing protein, partial [Kofleriaceae bacterium]